MKDSTLHLLDELIERIPELSGIREPIELTSKVICDSYKQGGMVLACGNGGSAADAEHIVGELMKGFCAKREVPVEHVEMFRKSGAADWEYLVANLQQAIPAIALTNHPALSSAIINDTDPHMVFAQQVYGYGRKGDVLIGLSTSGNAKNVGNALKVARAMGLKTIGMTGAAASQFDDLCDILIKAPTRETYRVQEYHLPIYHTICLMVENELFVDD